uniref:Uncharacterized protein n=1 Tax=Arundo donax TaxID=35708 RepID=A0A0A9G7J0_ARUDO
MNTRQLAQKSNRIAAPDGDRTKYLKRISDSPTTLPHRSCSNMNKTFNLLENGRDRKGDGDGEQEQCRLRVA